MDREDEEREIAFITDSPSVFTVIASSPNKKRYHHFAKRSSVDKIIMPLWSRDELLKG